MADDIRIVVLADDQASGPLNQIATGALRSVGAAVVSMAGDAVQALASFGASSIKVAGDFEAGMNTFQAAAGDSLAAAGLSVDDFRDKFIQIGAELPVSTSAVQEAATTLIKGGLDPLVVKMGGLESSIKFAAAAGMDLNQAAELSIKQLGTFVPITASAAEQTAFLASSQDLLVKAAGASTLDVDKLGDAMLGAGGAAKASGVDYQDFVTTMGLISPGFQSAATAGTSYKNFLTRLIPQTSDATGWMQKLGLYTSETGSKFFDATGAFVGNRQAAELLSKAFAGLSDAERSEAAAMIFGNDAKDAAIALAANGAAGYDKFADAMAKASGVEATAATVQQGFNIALDNFHGSIEALQIVVGTALLPALTLLFNGVLSPAINTVTTLAQALIGSSDAFARLPPVLQSVVIFFGDLWAAGMAIGAAFTSAGTYSAAFGAALDSLGAALGLPAGMLSTVSFAVQDFIAAIAPAATAIAAFVMGTGDLGTVADFLIELFGVTIGGLLTDAIGVLNNYATVWIDLGTTIYNVVAALMSGDLAGAWAALTSGITQVITDYQVYAASLGQLILSLGQTIVGAVVTYAPIIAAQALTWGTAFISWIAPYIPIALGYLAGFAASVWGWVAAQAPVLLAQIGSWGTAFISWIGPAIPPALAALGGLASSVFGWVGQQAAPLVASFVAWATALVEWIPGATVTFLAAWPGMLSNFLDWIAGAAGPLLAQLATWAAQFVAWIVPMIPGFVMALGGILLALGTFIVTSAAVIASKIIVWAGSMLGWVASNVLPALPGILGGILSSIISWIVGPANASILSSALSIGKSLVDGFVKGIVGGVSTVINAAKNLAQSAYQAAMGALQSHSPSRLFAYVGGTIPGGMDQGITAGMPKVTTNLVNGITNLAGKAAAAVEAGAKAIAAADAYKDSRGSGLSGFLASFANLAIQFNDTAVSLGGRVLGTATRFAETIGKVTGVLETGVKGLNALADLAAPSRESVAQFGNSVALVIGNLATVAAWFDAKAVKAAAVFAESAGKILAVVGPAIEAFRKLPDLVVPSRESVAQFGDSLALVIGNLATVAAWFDAKAVAAAAVFAESVGKILAMIGAGVEAFGKLANLRGVSVGTMEMFVDMVDTILRFLQGTADYFNGEVLGALAAFGEGAQKALSFIATAVDGLAKIGELRPYSVAVLEMFVDMVDTILRFLQGTADYFNGAILTALASFGEGAQKALSFITTAVDGLTKIGELQPYSVAVLEMFVDMVDTILRFLQGTADYFNGAVLESLAAFGEGAQKALSFIGAGVDGLLKIGDLRPVSAQAIGLFVDLVNVLLTGLATAASGFSSEAVAAAGQFSDAAGKAVAILADGIEGLSLVSTFTGVSEAAILRFADGVRLAVAAMAGLAAEFGAEATASAKAFAQAAGESTDFLKKGVEGFRKLGELTEIPKAGMGLFAAGVVALIDTIIQLSGMLSTETLQQANRFANAIDLVITVVKSGLDALSKLGGDAAGIKQFTDALITQVEILSAALVAQARPAAQNIGLAIAYGVADGITAGAPAIQNAIVAALNAGILAAEQTLGIASPSKVFTRMGQQSGAGFVGGAETMQPAVAAAGQGLAQAASAGAADLMPAPRRSAPAAGAGGGSVVLNVAAGAIVIHAAAGQSEQAIADAGLARLQQLARMAAQS